LVSEAFSGQRAGLIGGGLVVAVMIDAVDMYGGVMPAASTFRTAAPMAMDIFETAVLAGWS